MKLIMENWNQFVNEQEGSVEESIHTMIQTLLRDPFAKPFGTAATFIGVDLSSFADAVGMDRDDLVEWYNNQDGGFKYYFKIDDELGEIRISHPSNL